MKDVSSFWRPWNLTLVSLCASIWRQSNYLKQLYDVLSSWLTVTEPLFAGTTSNLGRGNPSRMGQDRHGREKRSPRSGREHPRRPARLVRVRRGQAERDVRRLPGEFRPVVKPINETRAKWTFEKSFRCTKDSKKNKFLQNLTTVTHCDCKPSDFHVNKVFIEANKSVYELSNWKATFIKRL